MLSRLLITACCLPLLAACQSHTLSNVPSVRVQGQLSASVDGWQIKSCDDTVYALNLHSDDALSQALEQMDTSEQLSIDIRLQADDTRYQVNKLYRLATEAKVCEENAFRKLFISASGNEPFWHVRVSKEGLVLTRPDHSPLALPYLEEQLSDGTLYLSSQANHQNLSLWLAPTLCQDSMSGNISHMTAKLTFNDQQFDGCAYLGGARE